MDDNLEKYLDIEKNRLQKLINEAYDVSDLKKSIKDLNKDLDNLYKNRKKASDEDLKYINESIKKIKEKKDEEEDLVKKLLDKKKKAEEQIDDRAKKNIFSQEKLTLNSLENIHVKKILLEKKYKKAVEDVLSSINEEEKQNAVDRLESVEEEIKILQEKERFTKKELEDKEKISKLVAKEQALRKAGDKEALKVQKEINAEKRRILDEKFENGEISAEEYASFSKDLDKESRKISNQQAMADWGSNVKKELGQAITKAINSGLNQINVAIEDVTSHRTKIMARLQGIGGREEYDYEGLLDTVAKNLAVSPYVTQKAFMQKLDEAVDKGIAYNVEQRAFLQTIKDDIATTFDAFDSNLLRLIRLQQADSTAARLGMEASLTKTLNSIFSDTSYLSDMYDNISAAIVESESLMSRNAATEFEYVVQKWMGALYSLGASNELISQVAQGINYIGTGNVQALASNSPLQTLFAMSASRSGLDYADLLVKGLDASNTNQLLKSMVEYLKEIAEDNRANNVVKSAYGDLYNMSLADMRAITSLTQSDISSLYSQNMSYSDMQTSLANQFNAISQRLSTGEMIKNVMDNFIYSTGSEIAQNAISYTLWQVTDLIENATGGIHLPAISVFGNMIDLSSFTIEGIMKTGLVGLATLGQIGNIVSSIGNKGGLNLNAWGYEDVLQRGQETQQMAGSVSSTSGSMYVGSSSSSDIKKSSISGATEESGEVAEITNEGMENEYSFDDWYKAILIDEEPIYIKSAEEFSSDDIYKAMYKDKTPIPVSLDYNNGLGSALMNLTSYMLSINKITDVNIKKSDIQIPATIYTLDNKLKEEIKNYIKTVYLDLLSTELRESLIGQTKNMSGATIAKVCDKIINDKIDVEVKNNNFDRFLDIQSGLFG